MFFVDLDAAVKDSRETEVRISSESVCVDGAHARLDTGEWKTALDGICFWTTEMVDHPCSVVPPGGTYMLSNVRASLTLEESNGHSPSSVTARFHMVTTCKEGTAIPTEYVWTEPVKVDLPAISAK
jgi:hypothetical protein